MRLPAVRLNPSHATIMGVIFLVLSLGISLLTTWGWWQIARDQTRQDDQRQLLQYEHSAIRRLHRVLDLNENALLVAQDSNDTTKLLTWLEV